MSIIKEYDITSNFTLNSMFNGFDSSLDGKLQIGLVLLKQGNWKIKVREYDNDQHNTPHFHLELPGYEGSFEISTFNLISENGKRPSKGVWKTINYWWSKENKLLLNYWNEYN